MLFRFVVAMLCLIWSAAEFQCPGPGRFSTSPGFCTNEYYACNREPNKEYIAYVLSCPGHTLFNERTRRCSNAKAISCTVATNTNQTGQQSPSVKVTATRSQTQRTRTSPGLFAYRINPSSATPTTRRKTQVYTKPGRPSRVTTKPHRVAAPIKTQSNQWRIKLSTTKKKSNTAWTKISTSFTEMTNSFKQTTVTDPFRIANPLFKKMSTTVYYKTMSKSKPTAGDFSTLQVTPTSITNANLAESISALIKAITTERTPSQQSLSLTEPVSKFTESDRKDVTHLSKISEEMLKTTMAMKLLSSTMSSSQQEQQCTQIAPSQFTKPTVQSTTPISSLFHNDLFETTPESLLKDYDKPIPFIDSLEPTEKSNVMKIVYISGNSESILGSKVTQRETDPDGKKNKQNQIQYFHDPDINNTGKSPQSDIKENRLKVQNILSSGYGLPNEAHTPVRKLITRKRQPKDSPYIY